MYNDYQPDVTTMHSWPVSSLEIGLSILLQLFPIISAYRITVIMLFPPCVIMLQLCSLKDSQSCKHNSCSSHFPVIKYIIAWNIEDQGHGNHNNAALEYVWTANQLLITCER